MDQNLFATLGSVEAGDEHDKVEDRGEMPEAHRKASKNVSVTRTTWTDAKDVELPKNIIEDKEQFQFQ